MKTHTHFPPFSASVLLCIMVFMIVVISTSLPPATIDLVVYFIIQRNFLYVCMRACLFIVFWCTYRFLDMHNTVTFQNSNNNNNNSVLKTNS